MHIFISLLALLVSLGVSRAAWADYPTMDELKDMTLEDLLNRQQTTIASQKATTTRSAPGIVTVLSADDIARIGARDLVDLLDTVPGFHIAGEIYSSDGLAVRGIYANEGRALLMIDGIMINETLYGNFPLYGRFAIEQIEQIEIIRGAGSAMYGGFAALAVINIVTKGVAGPDHCETSAATSIMGNVFSHQSLSGLCRRKLGPVAVDFAAATQRSNRSTTGFSNFNSGTGVESPIDLNYENRMRDFYMNAGVQAYGIKVRGILDTYTAPSRSIYGTEALPRAYDVNYWTYSALASYEAALGSKLHVTPSYNYKVDSPWQVKDHEALVTDPAAFFDVRNIRQTAGVKLSYDATESLSLLLGGEYMEDRAHAASPSPMFKVGTRDLAYHSAAVFGQVMADTAWVNIAAGARYEDHSAFDPAFVPRLALTRQLGRWHIKGLWSKAYRNPSISNINSFDTAHYKLQPEKTDDIEVEGGFQYSSSSLVTLNLFDERITDAIIYVSATDSYITAPHLGTRGFELEHKSRLGWGSTGASYSFYKVSQNDVQNYKVDRHPDALLATPQHKISGYLSYRLSENSTLTPSAQLLGPNFTNAFDRSAGTYTEQQINPVFLLNLNLRTEDLLQVKGLSASLGVFNLLNQTHKFVLAYRSEHEDIPGPARDFVIRLGYNKPF